MRCALLLAFFLVACVLAAPQPKVTSKTTKKIAKAKYTPKTTSRAKYTAKTTSKAKTYVLPRPHTVSTVAPAMGAGTKTVTKVSTTSVPTSVASAAATGVYYLNQSNRGSAFYANNNWDFWSWADPTHGNVTFLNQTDATAQGLIGIDLQGRAFAAASTQDLPLGTFRPSVRFQSKNNWNSGLVIFDVVNMPVGCATWPALWTVNGVNWPYNGEIDVMEGIGYTSGGNNANLVSVHLNKTSPIATTSSLYSGSKLTSSNCMTNYGLGNTGCSFRDSNTNGPSWGPNFNAKSGGIWAMQFGKGDGVKAWFWGRQSGKIPAELNNPLTSSANLHPSTWGTPMANFQSPIINQQILGQQIILDITIAGDWAGNVAMDGNCGTNYQSAIAKGSNYASAKFVLNGIDVYCLNSANGC